MKKLFLIFSIFFSSLLLIAVFFLVILFSKPLNSEIVINIPKNSSVSTALTICSENGLFKPKWAFSLIAQTYAYFSNREIKTGKYKLNDGYSNAQILKILFSSRQKNVVKVTIPEGKDLKGFAEILEQKLELEEGEFLKLASADSLLKARKIDGKNVEGYLMPNTYEFYQGQDAKDILDRLLNEQEKLWKETFNNLSNYTSLNKREILTLASIVEAETSVPEERKIVAGVYLNRLRIGMKLEADPTVQYAIGSKKKLTYKDLEYDSRYNTYRYTGLPPGPINNPSSASILAALEPEKHKYIYFVAVGDGSGRHNFSVNEKQHLKAVAEYRKNRKENS